MNNLQKNILIVFVLAIMLTIALSACSVHADRDPDAQTPTITSISPDITTVLNVPKELSVGVEINDKGTLSFQWYEAESKLAAGTTIPDATERTFSPETNEVGIFYYYCVIVNRLGSSTRSVTSPMISYAVSESVDAAKPVIAAQPANVTADFGEDFTLSVIAYSADGGTLSYQWYFCAEGTEATAPEASNDTTETGDAPNDGMEDALPAGATHITSANSASYGGIVSAESLGNYFCVITNKIKDNNDGGQKSASVRTNTAIVSNSVVNANTPAITAQPADTSAIIPAICVFSVGAYTADDGVLTYQWHKVADGENDGTEIEGETSTQIRVTTSTLGKTGYYCVITNTIEDNGDGGTKSVSVQSETAWLDAVYLKDVVSAPAFTKQPTALNIAPYNQSIEISCEAESAQGTLSYRWYASDDGTTTNGTAVAGANSAVLSLAPITEKGIYYYYCVATNSIGDESGLSMRYAAAISDVVSVACTGLPTLYLDTNIATSSITRDSYVQGSMKLISQEYGNFSYTFSKAKEGVKGRGNASWGFPKKGYNIKFDKKKTFFGLPSAKKWCIVSNYGDTTLLHNSYSSVLGTEIFNTDWNAHFVFVDVVMNGEYLGNYIFCEKITLTEGRIETQDISDVEENLAAGNESKVTDTNGDGEKTLADDGFILEVDFRGDADFAFRTEKGLLVTLKDPDEVSAEIQERVKEITQNAEDSLYGDNFTDEIEVDGKKISAWMQYIDIDSLLDWYIVNEFAKQLDSTFITSVYMWYNPVDGKLHMGPNWDFDNSFGNWHRDPFEGESPEGWFTRRADGHAGLQSVNWVARMPEDDLFNSLLKERWNDKKSELYSSINERIQLLADEIMLSAEYNFMKWQRLGTNTTLKTAYQNEVSAMIDWCNARYNWLDFNVQ